MADFLSKARGCLVGGAVGDALGYPVEFDDWKDIAAKYGANGITDYDPDFAFGLAVISDDTQMTMFTAEGLLNGRADGWQRIPGVYVWKAYLEWYAGQNGRLLKNGSALAKLPSMRARRAPGITCLRVLGDGEPGCEDEPVNNSKGCGGVMRVAPAALMFPDDIERAARTGAACAALTHGHSLGWLSAASMAWMIHRAVFGGCACGNGLTDIMAEAMDALKRLYPDNGFVEKQNGFIRLALELAGQEGNDVENIERIGGGWTAEDALGIAVYCCVKYQNDFSKAMIAAVNHSGDSHSTGAIAGNILGAYLGFEAIEDKWLDKLEARDDILAMAERIVRDGGRG